MARSKKQREKPQGIRIAVDYGSTVTLVYNNASDSVIIEYKSLVEMVKDVSLNCGPGTQIIAERTLGSYDWVDYNEALAIAKEAGILIWKINQNATKNYRLDFDIVKTNEDDARIIWSIGFLSNYHKEEFTPRLIPAGKDIKTLIRLARSQKYVIQKAWLRKHKLPQNAAYCQMVVVAIYMRETGQGRKAFDRACGLYGLGCKSIQRASAMRDLLKSMMYQRGCRRPNRKGTGREVVDTRNKAVRKECLKEIRKLSRKLFWLVNKEVPVVVPEYTSTALYA